MPPSLFHARTPTHSSHVPPVHHKLRQVVRRRNRNDNAPVFDGYVLFTLEKVPSFEYDQSNRDNVIVRRALSKWPEVPRVQSKIFRHVKHRRFSQIFGLWNDTTTNKLQSSVDLDTMKPLSFKPLLPLVFFLLIWNGVCVYVCFDIGCTKYGFPSVSTAFWIVFTVFHPPLPQPSVTAVAQALIFSTEAAALVAKVFAPRASDSADASAVKLHIQAVDSDVFGGMAVAVVGSVAVVGNEPRCGNGVVEWWSRLSKRCCRVCLAFYSFHIHFFCFFLDSEGT